MGVAFPVSSLHHCVALNSHGGLSNPVDVGLAHPFSDRGSYEVCVLSKFMVYWARRFAKSDNDGRLFRRRMGQALV